MQTVQKEADKRARKIQFNFTQFLSQIRENNQQKKKGEKKRKKTQKVEIAHLDTKKQLTLNPVTRNGKRK